ncbi:peroxiredoxin [uncultured Azohydromonas sp.]|jgi:Peroxiredoxin|uniref:peroxiredoxin n=1 Tax=uncultured Azohydromonas sp. TaxID=487342 RepID=UPI0026349DBD|nr:redoxin domain-containing protein [uncultured Azohydromonas sp.]
MYPFLQQALATVAFAAAGALLATSARAALREGDSAPAFQARASLAGQAFDYKLQDALARGPVVVYFYPAAYTGGCNLQARTFAERMPEFEAAGASVVGVSLDGIERLNEFSADPQYCAGKLPVASDADGRIARGFDVGVSATPSGRRDTRGRDIDHGRADRTTFVLRTDGRVAAVIGGIAPDANVLQALQAVRRIAPAR